MVRPHSSSRSRQRSFSDHTEHHGGRTSFSSRGFRGAPGKASPSWRDNHSGGPSTYPKRPGLMGETRARQQGHWIPPKKDNHRPYTMSQDSQRGRNRTSPHYSTRPPPVHRTSPHGSSQTAPGHHRPFQGNNSGRFSPSSRYFHNASTGRRGPSPHSSFRPRYQSPAYDQERSWASGRPQIPRTKPYGRPPYTGQRWNGPGGFPKPNWRPRPLHSPERRSREFHERSSYPERWSAERDPRKQHGEAGRDQGRKRPMHHVPDWVRREDPLPRPFYRSPSWKAGPPHSVSRFPPPLRSHERPIMRPFKRRILDVGHPQFSGPEHGPPKRFRREMIVRPFPLKGFGGRGLSLKDKSRLITRRKFREESVVKLKMPLSRPKKPKDRSPSEEGNESSNRVPVRPVIGKKDLKRQTSRHSDSDSADPERNSGTQGEPQRSVRARSSSPLDKRDLVVVSHWEAGTTRSVSPKSNTSWKSRISNGNERFGNSSHSQKQPRPFDGPRRFFRKPGPFQKPPFQLPRLNSGFKKGPDGIYRRPLMATILSRPPFKKPMLRKSQSIMAKYKNMQSLRHKAPPHQRQSTSYRRW